MLWLHLTDVWDKKMFIYGLRIFIAWDVYIISFEIHEKQELCIGIYCYFQKLREITAGWKYNSDSTVR